MERFFDNLMRQAEENPVMAMAAAAALLTAVSKLMNANTDARNSKTWNAEVNRRIMKFRKDK